MKPIQKKTCYNQLTVFDVQTVIYGTLYRVKQVLVHQS